MHARLALTLVHASCRWPLCARLHRIYLSAIGIAMAIERPRLNSTNACCTARLPRRWPTGCAAHEPAELNLELRYSRLHHHNLSRNHDTVMTALCL